MSTRRRRLPAALATMSLAAKLLAARPAQAMPIAGTSHANAMSALGAVAVSTQSFVSPSTAPYASATGIVGTIRLHEKNVFDPMVPGEDWWPFQFAQKVHVLTKPSVIQQELLVKKDRAWDALEALESERNLRATRFMRKAEIRPHPATNGRLDLDVDTQDSWTTVPQISFGTEGGDSYFIYGLEEQNLLGYGKDARLYHSQVGPLLRNEARYVDPRLWGSRVNLVTLYAKTNQGDEIGTGMGRPFFSIDSRYSWNALWARVIQQDTLYQNAEQSNKFLQNFRTVNSSIGLRLGESRDPVHRTLVGTHYEKDEFSATSQTTGTLPRAREMSGPQIGYSMIQPHYVKETYINRMRRVEDFNLGNEFSVAGGAMMSALGSDRDRWTLGIMDQQGLRLGEGRFALALAGLDSRLAGGRPENAVFYASGNLFWKTIRGFPQTFVTHVEWDSTKNLDGERQILLGGSTGLRGYKNNSFTGTRVLLLNVEDRTFMEKEFFHLFLVGGAAFFDLGSVASKESSVISWHNSKSDVGFGLRFSPTRSTTGSVVRVDLAYALNRGPGPSRWVLNMRAGQAFQVFNSTNRNILRSPSDSISDDSAAARLTQR